MRDRSKRFRNRRILSSGIGVGMVVLLGACAAEPPRDIVPYEVNGAAIREPLAGHVGDVARGREILIGRDGNCLLCHAVPETGAQFMGNLGPLLSGVGARLDAGQLRLRIVDSRRLNPDTIMPPYHAVNGLNRVGAKWRGKPVLTAQEVEDVIAYLRTLQ